VFGEDLNFTSYNLRLGYAWPLSDAVATVGCDGQLGQVSSDATTYGILGRFEFDR
jgi:hypothetical protein